MTNSEVLERAAAKWPDQRSRLADGFYSIKDKTGAKVPFRMNEVQAHFYDARHSLNIILKARQLGFTTLIQLIALDECLFNKDTSTGVIAQTLPDATAFFDDKIKYAYDNLPLAFREHRATSGNNLRELKFNNDSKIRVGVSLRSGTFQHLHVSEFGKICAKTPEKAKEIVTGAFNTVAIGQNIDIESTAEGQAGKFFDMCQTAKALRDSGSKLTALDFKFHFYAWHGDPQYTLDPEGVAIASPMSAYFEKLGIEHGINLDDGQRAWYVKKYASQKEEMKREYPSTPEEAFEAAIEGSYYHHELAGMRRRQQIRFVAHDPRYPVSTFWDLGMNDKTAIWFYQNVNGRHSFINYFEDSHQHPRYYAAHMKMLNDELGYGYDNNYVPHDGDSIKFGMDQEVRQTIQDLSGVPTHTIPRITDKLVGIQAVRNILPMCHIDESECFTGLAHLASYRKEFDAKRGTWKDRPFHGDESNGADAFRTFAEAHARNMVRSAAEYGDYGDDFDDDYQDDGRNETGGY